MTSTHPVLNRCRPVAFALGLAATLALAALAAFRLDPVGRVQPRLCAGLCGLPAPISRGVA